MIYLDAGDDCGGRKAQEPAEEEAAKRNNFILYGHHMKNGTMFAGLEQYRSAEFFEEHRTIFFDMLAGTGDYEVFCRFLYDGARKPGNSSLLIWRRRRKSRYGRLMETVRVKSLHGPKETAGMAPAAF